MWHEKPFFLSWCCATSFLRWNKTFYQEFCVLILWNEWKFFLLQNRMKILCRLFLLTMAENIINFPLPCPRRKENHILHVSFINYSWWCRSFQGWDEMTCRQLFFIICFEADDTTTHPCIMSLAIFMFLNGERRQLDCVILLVL